MFTVRILLIFIVSTPLAAGPYFMHCYDYGCRSTMKIRFSDSQWQQIRNLFSEDRNSFQEKQEIRQAIATMERYSGEIAGTHRDKARNPSDAYIGQHDCIDESTNTFQYLSALEELELLKWHRVDLKQRRVVWFVSHWTAVIAELNSGHKFAVDSWYRDNGELPQIQPLPDWKRRLEFTAAYNPELVSQ